MHRALVYILIALVVAGSPELLSSCTRQPDVGDESVAQIASPDRAAPNEEAKTMRRTVVAGPPGRGFYVDDPSALREQVERFLREADPPEVEGDVLGLMVPHAGYQYSGPVAAYGYKILKGRPISTIILLGNSHNMRFSGAALSAYDAWDTPLGPVEVDQELNEKLAAQSPAIVDDETPHAPEHSLEVQLPFLKVVLPEAKIVPILISSMSRGDCETLAQTLAPVLKQPDVVLIASSDMSHYPAYDDATRCDKATLNAIVTMDPDQVYAADKRLMSAGTRELHCTLCGLDSVATTMMATKQVGADKATVLKYANSGDTAGMRSQCVGYGAVAFTAPAGTRGKTSDTPAAEAREAADPDLVQLTDEEKRRLLQVARRTLDARLGSGEAPSLGPGDSAALARKTACFVTLKERGRLRGCIGELEPREPLIRAVASRAIAAATQDPRFPPVTARELAGIAIEISAMSPLRRVGGPEEIVVGKHGVVVRQGTRSGVFLPQVAPEQGWDRDTMLTILCTEKAGLPPDAWRKGAELQVFTANVFGEEEFGLAPPGSTKER
jgi:AmmeMemoRadiSam system protein B/AmmeMemoRadiSam system protein A